jgi:hypothetical protein
LEHDGGVPYDPSDPRAQLASTPATATANAVPRPAHYRELDASPADVTAANGSRTWWTRSQAMVVGYTEAQPDDELAVGAGHDRSTVRRADRIGTRRSVRQR